MLKDAHKEETAPATRVDPKELLDFYGQCLLYVSGTKVPFPFVLVDGKVQGYCGKNTLFYGFRQAEATPKDLGSIRVHTNLRRGALEICTLRTRPLRRIPDGFDLCDFWLRRTITFAFAYGITEITYKQPQSEHANGQAASLLRVGFAPDVMLNVAWGRVWPKAEARIWQRKLEEEEPGTYSQLRAFARTEAGSQALYKARSCWRWNLSLV